MKLGQMASYLDAGPARARARRARRAAAGRAADGARAGRRRRSSDELGAPPDRAVRRVGPGARSRRRRSARCTGPSPDDGRAVAVKVQYPGVDEAIASDLDNVGLLFGGMGLAVPGPRAGPDGRGAAGPPRRGARLRERGRQPALLRRLLPRPPVHPRPRGARRAVDRPGAHHRAGRGRRASTRCSPGARTERNLAAEALYRFVFGSLYRLHAFNGDPHPGNYLFRPGGQVTFLDFGLVKHFTPDEVAAVRRDDRRHGRATTTSTRFRAIVERDRRAAARAAVHDERSRTTSATSTSS